MGRGSGTASNIQKSYFDVLGICCSSEVTLVERILNSMAGVEKFSVIVPSRTVIVFHDPLVVSQTQIVNALNKARLEASVRTYGSGSRSSTGNKSAFDSWPSPFVIACGLLLFPSAFQMFFLPLRWLGVAAAAAGLPPMLMRSFEALRRFTLDINILMLIAVSGAMAMEEYTEAGLTIFLFTIAQWLEVRASTKAFSGMSTLLSLGSVKATLASSGEVVEAGDVEVGTILAVKPGESIPIDGVVVEGQSEVDERMLTGESMPVHKQTHALVWAGTINIDGYLGVMTTALAKDSAVAKMTKLVEEAQSNRSKMHRMIDKCAKYYTPGVVLIAIILALVPLAANVHHPKFWEQLALVVLVSACPCALVLSTPVASFCALLKAAKMGLLIRGGDVIEALAKTKVVAFDKTGTITKGEFDVLHFHQIDKDFSFQTLLYWVSSIESKSSHPMATALIEFARQNSIEPKPDIVSNFQNFPGEGILGEIDGHNIYVGNKRIASRAGCTAVPNVEDISEGPTVGYIFSCSKPIGIFTLADNCRTGVSDAIKELKALGIKTAMLTGDSTTAATHAQNQLEHLMEVVHAELLPRDKVQILKELKTREGHATMVGDGINDAPALAAANVGISMGISGSAVAMETSHITLMSNDVRKIPKAIRLARRARRKIIFNIFISLATKAVVLAWAIAGHPLLWAAILADVGTCLVVILNSMALLGTNGSKEKKCCDNLKHKSGAENKDCTHCAMDSCGSHGRSSHKHCCGELRKRNRHGCHDHVEENGNGCSNWKLYEHGCHRHGHHHHHEETHEHGYHKQGKKQVQEHDMHCHGDCEDGQHCSNGKCEQKHNCYSNNISEDSPKDSTELSHCCNGAAVQGKHEHSITIDVCGKRYSEHLHEQHSGQQTNHDSFCSSQENCSDGIECCEDHGNESGPQITCISQRVIIPAEQEAGRCCGGACQKTFCEDGVKQQSEIMVE